MDEPQKASQSPTFFRPYTYDPSPPKSTGRRPVARFLRRITVLIGLSLVLLGLSWFMTLPDVTVLARTNPTSTALMEIRHSQAKEQGRPIKRRWMWVPLSRISPHLRHAVVAAEDALFFTHEGFDWEGIKEAAMYNLEAGEFKRGGSTITQQLAKNLYLSSERSLFRKAKEALITWELEQRLSKKRILELYLNVAEWGHGIYGAEAAAHHHFGKPAHELTSDEAAWLAAMLPSPRRYDPLRKTTFLTQRHERILRWIDRQSATPIPIADE